MGLQLQLVDAFLRAWPEPLPSLRSVQGLELTLILQESPPASASILVTKWR